MISVIIPTYNRHDFLVAAIRSVQQQKIALPVEIIVINDGSTDDTARTVADLQAVSVTNPALPTLVYLFQKNKGAAAARNAGIQAAQGEYIAFLDSDDQFLPHKLSTQYQQLTDHPSCRVSHTLERWYRRGQHLNQKKKHQPPSGDIFQASLPMCVVGMSTILTHRSLFQEYGGFDETLPCCEDYALWLKVGAQEPFLLVEQALTLKNGGREDQLSIIHRQGMDRYRIQALTSLLESGCLSPPQAEAAQQERQRKCQIYGQGCLKHGRPQEAASYLQLSQQPVSHTPQTTQECSRVVR